MSARRGITDLDDQEAGVIRAALEKTERIIVLAGGSKFGDVALSTVVPIKSVSTIVIDPSADPVEVERIAREGVEVILVEPGVSAPARRGRCHPGERRAACGSHMTPPRHDLFGVSKPIIAMPHLPGLPGRPRHDRQAGLRPIVDTVARDLAALQEAGVDGLPFCNEGDLPYQIGGRTDLAQLREAKAAVPGTPVLANAGVTADGVPDILAVAAGAIVGTSLKAGGITWNPVDPVRAPKFMTAAKRARESAVNV